MIILLHTSKTMRAPSGTPVAAHQPELLRKAESLAEYLKTLSKLQLMQCMHLSPKLAEKTHALAQDWNTRPDEQRSAIDGFIGDIYSGLQVPSWSEEDRSYANDTLRILSGLYGILRPLDGVYPYRLEMGYKLPDSRFTNLHNYWGETIVRTLPEHNTFINLSAVEYSKTVTAFIDPNRITMPSFLTISPDTKEPTFVVVHAKIARGAFAAWLIKNRVTDPAQLRAFNELGYVYDARLSEPQMPVFVCKSFGGLGLSIRLK